jgi:hypothetical protein
MDNVILATYRCPNEALAWGRRIRDNISRIPLLAWVCEFAVPAAVTKREDCGWQIAGRVNFVEACSIQQSLPIFQGKLRNIRVAQALNRCGEK